MSPSAHSSDETRKRCASRTVRREPTVSGQHTQPTRATQGRGQGMLRGSLGASVSSLSTNLQGGGLGLAPAGGRRKRLPKRKTRAPRSARRMSLLRKTRQRGTGEAPCIACAGTGKAAGRQRANRRGLACAQGPRGRFRSLRPRCSTRATCRAAPRPPWSRAVSGAPHDPWLARRNGASVPARGGGRG